MKWMQERDALIAQTLAFVQSVTGKKDEAGATAAVFVPDTGKPDAAKTGMTKTDIAPVLPPSAQAAEPQPSQPSSPPTPRPVVPADFRSELTARLASFRAHQERFNREREEYFSATLQKLRTAIKDAPPLRLDK